MFTDLLDIATKAGLITLALVVVWIGVIVVKKVLHG